MKKWLAIVISVVILVLCITAFMLGDLLKGKLGDKALVDSQNTSAVETTKYTVTFYSNNGTVLKIDSVKGNSSATPPVAPMMVYGTVFKSWDTDFSNVTQDLNVHPVYEEIKGKPNVLAVQSAYTQKDNTAVVPIQLCGDVCVSGLDITIRYDHELLKLESITEDKAVVYNDKTPGIIRLNYVSAENTVADVDICNLNFLVKATESEIPITIEINGIYAFKDGAETDNDLFIPESSVIDGKVFAVE